MIDDALLPAAAYLTGDAAADVLGVAVACSGRSLLWSRPNQVQYRPRSDLVVRYRAGVLDPDGSQSSETLLAATTVAGPPAGTVPVRAVADGGDELEVGVWRWPFDPTLLGLETAVTPRRAEQMLAGLVTGPLRVEVVAYRPCERAVVRVTGADDRQVYVKLVAPAVVPGLIARHHLLAAVGVPVPELLATDVEHGWVAMEALHGDTLRDRLKAGRLPWPQIGEFTELTRRLSDVVLPDAPPRRTRVMDASGHATILAALLPTHHRRLDELISRFRQLEPESLARRTRVVHGDLHEGQIVLEGNRIAGLLDLDDVGLGDPFDDMATLLGHLTYRATTSRQPAIAAYAANLREAFVATVDGRILDEVTAAVLVGLATGPYRVQQQDWRTTVLEQLGLAERLLDRHERSLSLRSRTPHRAQRTIAASNSTTRAVANTKETTS